MFRYLIVFLFCSLMMVSAHGDGHIEVSDGDTTITLEQAATRVVALEWSYAEDLLALGVQPVGVADMAGYHKWVKVDLEFADSVEDVGRRQEPNLEKIAALQPDLIIVPRFRAAAIYDDLSAIAPVLAFNNYPSDGSSQFQRMITTFMTIATAVGKEEQASDVLARVENTFAEVSEHLADQDKAGAGFIITQAFTSSDVPTMRFFTDNAMAVSILEQLGLENAWDDAAGAYGFSTVGVESLGEIDADTLFFYIVQDDDNIFTGDEVSPLWDSLEFVQNGNAHPLGGDIWLFGGPLSAEILAQVIHDSLSE